MGLRSIRLPQTGIFLYESKHREGDVVDVHHHDVYQILYALDGEGRIALEGRAHEAARDQVVFIAPGAEHAIVSDTRLTLLVLAFDAAALRVLSALEPAAATALSRSFLHKPGALQSGEWRGWLRKLLHDQARAEQEPLGGSAVKLTLLNVLHMLAKSAQAPTAGDANTLRAERIRRNIDEHYFQPFSLEALADKMGISSRYVNAIFKEQFGMTPVRYLTEVRIERARKLLAETDKDIVSVCFEVGYDTLSTFYRTFKNIVRLSPKQYRQLAREHGGEEQDPSIRK
ncbi:AraC family transcriptional regulator [Paenibacillus antri]|uniref:AraC family transcriptional regulator n=1 Tax=Paenibacillus antri TaxID=2582848 RepID=A0A5R9G513_9BACL|nr:AraC family transcriptional regulator [Paenibacillus antri]TLS51452.1 AraC family transcriptional regulator [Paenibacillus antri]